MTWFYVKMAVYVFFALISLFIIISHHYNIGCIGSSTPAPCRQLWRNCDVIEYKTIKRKWMSSSVLYHIFLSRISLITSRQASTFSAPGFQYSCVYHNYCCEWILINKHLSSLVEFPNKQFSVFSNLYTFTDDMFLYRCIPNIRVQSACIPSC